MFKTFCILLSLTCLQAAAPFFAFAQSNLTEKLTISTYYPSPYGVYRTLQVKKALAVGGSGSSTVNSLNQGQLFINNSLILNTLPITPLDSAGKAGQVIYVGGADKMLKYHDGIKWVNATLTPPPCPVGKTCLTPNTSESCPMGQSCKASGSTYVTTVEVANVACCDFSAICNPVCSLLPNPASCPVGSNEAFSRQYPVGSNGGIHFYTFVKVCTQ
jgi:hypothetical protein